MDTEEQKLQADSTDSELGQILPPEPLVSEMPKPVKVKAVKVPKEKVAKAPKVIDAPPPEPLLPDGNEESGDLPDLSVKDAMIPIVDGIVFPSNENTISVEMDADYNGAHKYIIQNCLGFSKGKTQYDNSFQTIQFVQKNQDGSMTPGVQSEQLILALIDRHFKLNAVYESEQFHEMLQGLQLFLKASRERVEERMKRNVMGDLKK